jgi:hypothetical protein
MVEKLSKYENLGTPVFYFELFKLLQNKSQEWTEEEVKKYFYNRIVDGRNLFDGCLPLLKYMGILNFSKDSKIRLQASIGELLENQNQFNYWFIKSFLEKLSKDKLFQVMFNNENISFDTIYNNILIKNSAFTFKYSNIKQLLLDFGFLKIHSDSRIRDFIINPLYKDIFDKEILPKIKERNLNKEQLTRLLETQAIHGEEAEMFVLAYEKKRLKFKKKVTKISDYSVSAGFDILSFNTTDSQRADRFIEVKSYSGDIRFFLSRNEIETAKINRQSYFLYLVDRDKMHDECYNPLIIPNLYKEIIESHSWKKIPQNYEVFLRK